MRMYGRWVAITLVLVGLLAVSAEASKPRKLPANAYIKSAKIEILSGDIERYPAAIAMLDSLFMYYGPHSEGLHLMAAIYVDYTDKTADPWGKRQYVNKMVAYYDSLSMCCNNKEIKSNYRKDCKEYTELADSAKVKYWREFYNAGVEQLNFMGEVAKELKEITDSSSREFSLNVIQTNIDSCIANMELAIIFDPTNYQAYIAAGSAYEHKENWEEAIKWFKKGIEKAPNKDKLLPSIAYDYIRLDRYCEAIPYLKEFVILVPDDIKTMGHLAACYNNCQMFDSAAIVYRTMVAADSENTSALTNLGRYFNQNARDASDSSSAYQAAGNEKQVQFWRGKQMEAFDSSSAYFKKVFEQKPDDADAAEEYGLVSAIMGNYEAAAVAYTRLTELKPENEGHWSYLGDCYLNLKKFPEATAAYEKVVALDEDNRQIWQRLADLYAETGQKEKAAAARKKSE